MELAAHDVDLGEKVKQILNANFEHFVENWAQYFKDQQAQGRLSIDKNPKAMAQFLFATLNSINVISRKTTDVQVLFNIAETAIQGITA